MKFYDYRYPKGYRIYSHLFDYFDYSGINRAVHLYTTPKVYICDITISTSFGNSSEGNMHTIIFFSQCHFLFEIIWNR